MKHILATLLLLTLAAPAWGQDFEKGMQAYNRGDYATALRELRPLAKQGNGDAQSNLGYMYANGENVPQDHAEAVKWYRKAAEQGYTRAQVNLGVMYSTGQGVPQDYVEAAKWYRKAAEQGHATDQFALGVMYGEGLNVPQDHAEAVKWYRKAAEQGYARAQSNLGLMYAKGHGIPQDYVQAHMWANLGATNGDKEGTKVRDFIAKQMTPTQIAEAQRRAREWRPRQRVAATSPSTVGPWTQYQSAQPDAENTSDKRRRVARVQRGLARLGYYSGQVDGILGPKTRAAIRATKKARLEKDSTGSGFFVSSKGHILTNHHVVEDCEEVRLPTGVAVRVIAGDAQSDLALLEGPVTNSKSATFGQGRGIRPGDDIVVVGFPLHGFLTSDLSVTTANVSAFAGPGDDRRFIQITAPVQQGNRGGPLLDLAGNVAGVVVSKLDALLVAGLTGDIPQNVNFAVSAWAARAFLESFDVPYETAPSEPRLSAGHVAARARAYTVLVECWK